MKKINEYFDKYFPRSHSVVFLHAHPDDESFLSAGLISRLSHKRNCHVIYCAASLVKGQRKTTLRQEEAEKACSILGLGSNRISYLDFCEPKYTEIGAKPFYRENPGDIASLICDVIKRGRMDFPICLVSYDRNGGYGNKDHVILHKAGRIIEKRQRKATILYEVTINRDNMLNWLSDAKKRLPKEALPKLSYWAREFGLPESEIDFFYELNSGEIETKKKSLSAHKSQIKSDLFPMNLFPKDFKKIFGREYLGSYS